MGETIGVGCWNDGGFSVGLEMPGPFVILTLEFSKKVVLVDVDFFFLGI